ncbi:MAG: TIGR03943 family putative permease subunit [Anaerovoracaceae bacterium]|jgi:uncharacterized membrane protein YcgQ (UPF0703/DUF1980 family)
MNEIPVYLLTGFLDAGKTTFIQSLMEGDDFNAGERTLMLICEEGEVEHEPGKFAFNNTFFVTVNKEEDLDAQMLEEQARENDIDRVVVEYNGMWMLDSLYKNMPKNWVIYQEVMFADATTFQVYNDNMRQQTFDKMRDAELVIFNRCVRGQLDKMALHKIVRVANRKSQILYEFGEDDVEPDNIKDPLPFDLNAPLVTIKDQDYAEWYRDLNEEQEKYEGKTLRVKGRALTEGNLPENTFIFGRHLMTCCVADIQFAGLVCKWGGKKPKLENGEWVAITAKVKNEFDSIYKEEGPVLYCQKVEKEAPADPEVAQF